MLACSVESEHESIVAFCMMFISSEHNVNHLNVMRDSHSFITF